LLSDFVKYPIFIDAEGKVLSMPPIINSDYTGKVTKETRDIFIECSGFNLKFLMPALNIMVSALADRGGKIETVDVISPGGRIWTPDLKPKKIVIDNERVRKLSGLDLKTQEIVKLLGKSRYDARSAGGRLIVHYPAYRQDIMHQVDIIEDVIISYGYNRAEPVIPEISGKGKLTGINEFSEKISDIMIGLGAQEIITYILTNRSYLVEKMGLKDMKSVEVENPVSKNWSVFRTWIIPSLMEFLGKNTNREYPQNQKSYIHL